MADKVYTIVINAKGEPALKLMKDINKEGEKLAGTQEGIQKAQKKTTKGANDYTKRNKGVADATNNSTHAFSKMAQQMNGIVPIYATVAANVFAITAAFGALERAADFQILIDSADSLAVQTGRSLTSLASNMKTITGDAISMKEALVSASIAASAGFDNSTIEQLTQVARNASVALGREMTDALNRVFKGAIKAEPELLDELGIILRLETAANKYATAMGKTAKELTTFEKQQAVVNEVLDQGQKKFGRLSEVDPNPFTQLSAAFTDITNTLLGIVNTPIGSFLGFFTENIASLTAAIILLATSIAKQALPAIANMAKSGIESTERLASGFKNISTSAKAYSDRINKTRASVDELTKSAISFANISEKSKAYSKIMDTTASAGDRVTSALRSINGQIGAITRAVNKQGFISPEQLSRLGDLGNVKESLIGVRGEIDKTTKSTKLANATIRTGATAFAFLANSASIATLAVAGFATSMGIAAIETAEATGLMNKLKVTWDLVNKAGAGQSFAISGLSKLGSLAGSTGAILLGLVPIIAGVTIAFQVLASAYTAIKNALGFEDIAKLSEKLDEQKTALDKSAAAALNYEENLKNLPGTLSNINEQLTLQTNVLAGMAGELKKVNEALALDNGFGWWDELLDTFNSGQLDIAKDNIEKLVNQIDKLGFGKEVEDEVRGLASAWGVGGDTAQEASIKLEKLVKELQRVSNGAKEANQSIIDGVEQLNKSTSKLFGQLPSLGGIDQTLIAVSDIANRLDGKEFDTVADTLAGFSSLTLDTLGIKDVAEDFKIATLEATAARDTIKVLKEEVTALRSSTPGAFAKGAIGTLRLEAIELLESNLVDIENKITKNMSEPLTEAVAKFEKLSNAARDLKDQLTTLNLDKLNTLNTGADTVSILKKETDLRVNAIKIQTQAAIDGLAAIKRDNDEIDTAKFDAQQRYYRYREGEEANKKLADTAYSELGVLATRAKTNAEYQKKLQLQLDKTRGNSAALVQKLYEQTAKEIEKIVKLQSKGVTGLDDEYRELDSTLRSSLDTLVQLTGKTEEWAKGMMIVRKGSEDLESFLTKERIDSAKALNEQSYTMESTNLSLMNQLAVSKKLTSELWNRADAQWQITDSIKKAEIELQQSRVNAAQDDMFNAGMASPEVEAALEATYRMEKEQLDALTRAREVSNENNRLSLALQADKTISTMEMELKFLEQKARFGALFSKSDADALKTAKLRASLKGNDPKDIEKIIKLQEKLNKEARKFEFAEKLQDAAESMNNLADGINDVFKALSSNDSFDDFAAGLMLLQSIGGNMEGPLGNFTEGLATAGLAAEQYAMQMQNIANATFEARDAGNGELTQLQEKNFALQEQHANYSLIANAAGSLAGAFEEGSAAAKAFTLIQQGAALAAAVAAVANQGSGDPYTAFARIAAMIAAMSAVLGSIGMTLGGSGGTSSAAASKAYDDRMGSDALRDSDLQNNSMVESLKDLVEIDTQLFGATRDLQITMKNVGETFEQIGALIFSSITGANITSYGLDSQITTNSSMADLFNDVTKTIGDIFTLGLGGDFISDALGSIGSGLFGSSSVSSVTKDQGLDLSAQIKATEDGLMGIFDTFQVETVALITESSSSWFSSSSNSYIKSFFSEMDDSLANALGTGLDQTLTIINGLVTGLGSAIGGVDLSKIFGNLSGEIFGDEFISLFEISGEDAGEAIGLYFSSLSNEILGDVLPWLQDYSKAGEELTDTMLRITGNTIRLSNSFSMIGSSLEEVIGSLDIDPTIFDAASFAEISKGAIENITSSITSTRDLLDAELRNYSFQADYSSYDFDQVKVFNNPELIAQYESQLGNLYLELFTTTAKTIAGVGFDTEVAAASAAAAEAFKLEVVAAWEAELLKNFKDIDEFQELFAKFANAIFSETELLNFSIENATTSLLSGFTELGLSTEGINAGELVANAGADAALALKTFYETSLGAGTFTADILNGEEIDSVGAEIYATMVKTGAALDSLIELFNNLQEAIDELNTKYVQQIALFGLLGKELELLELAFDFNDAIIEATEVGASIEAVEMLYGLRRLEIVKTAFEEINNEIESSMDNIYSSIVDVSSNLDIWDDIAYSTIKINKLVERLKKGTTTVNLDGLLGNTEDFQLFIDNFSDIISGLSDEAPTSVLDEIGLVEQLREEIVNKYELESALLLDQIDLFKDLSQEINNFLDELIISDLSPLTNYERLGEATAQFLENAENVFSSDADVAENAAGNLLGSASELLEQASAFYAIGNEYVKVFDLVTNTLSGIDNTLLDQLNAPEADPLVELTEQTVAKLNVLDDILYQLKASNEDTYFTDIAMAVTEGMLPILGDLTTKLQTIDDGTWTTMVNLLASIDTAVGGTWDAVNAGNLNTQVNDLTGQITGLPEVAISESSFAMGTANVPYDMVAQIHQGEAIVPESMAQGIREGTLSLGEPQDNSDVVQAIQELTIVMAESQEDIVEATRRNVEASQEIAEEMSRGRQRTATRGIV